MVSYKATTDVYHISSELCLLGCHISTGKPQRGWLRAFLLGSGTSWIFSRGVQGVSQQNTQHPVSAARTPFSQGICTALPSSISASPFLGSRGAMGTCSSPALEELHCPQAGLCVHTHTWMLSIGSEEGKRRLEEFYMGFLKHIF